MWGQKKKQTIVSDFLQGINIFGFLSNSVYGKIKQTFNDIFTADDAKNYVLPKVIVIGNESTGKSSLLENITKCQLFPRDSKLCTKCPIRVKLNNGQSKYVVSYLETSDTIPSKTTTKIINLKNKNEIYQVIKHYMENLPLDHISENEITIDITDNDIPTFEFYDLPGIRTYPISAAETTTKLCEKYLSDKNSIVLCVVPATTTRLTSCQSIALISKMKMEENCILALTMADRLQPENIEDLLIKRIIKTSDEINGLNFAGYISVVNRVHSDILTLQDNDLIEQKWFNDNILQCIPDEYMSYEKEIKDNITVFNLITKMDELYNKFIHNNWKPTILSSIENKLNHLNIEYNELGDKDIDHTKLNKIINEFINKLFKNMFDHVFEQKSFSNIKVVNKLSDFFNVKLLNDNKQTKIKKEKNTKLYHVTNADMQKVAKAIHNKTGFKMGTPIFKVASNLLKENNKDIDVTLAQIDNDAQNIYFLCKAAETDTNEEIVAKKLESAKNDSDEVESISSEKVQRLYGIDFIKLYHNVDSIVENYLGKFDVKFILNQINEYFDSENVYKLKRFTNVRKIVLELFDHQFNELKHDKFNIIKDEFKLIIFKDGIVKYEPECVRYSYYTLFKLHYLFVLHILYPLSLFTVDLTLKDYFENDDYVAKRVKLENEIKKTNEHYSKINSI